MLTRAYHTSRVNVLLRSDLRIDGLLRRAWLPPLAGGFLARQNSGTEVGRVVHVERDLLARLISTYRM